MKTIVITGGNSGLGRELVLHSHKDGHAVYNIDTFMSSNLPSVDLAGDVRDKKRLTEIASMINEEHLYIDFLINCAGVNEISFLEDLAEEEWDRIVDINAKGIFLTSQAFLHLLSPGGTIINIISNAAHIPMTASLAYNASKGAALIMTKQMARELKPRHNITVIGVSPNKLSGTGMSTYIDKRVCETRGWTPEQAHEYQLKSLPAGKETRPDAIARFIMSLINSGGDIQFLNGCVLPYGA